MKKNLSVTMEAKDDLFDLGLLKEMDDKEFLADILGLYMANTPAELNALRAACDSQQFDVVCQLAHKLKSAAGLLGAKHFLAVLIKIEEAVKAEEVAGIPALCNELNEAYIKIEIYLQMHLTNIKTELNLVALPKLES